MNFNDKQYQKYPYGNQLILPELFNEFVAHLHLLKKLFE